MARGRQHSGESRARGRRPLRIPRATALLAEAEAHASIAERQALAAQRQQLSLDSHLAGDPCLACGRALLAPPPPDEDPAVDSTFIAQHADCKLRFWHAPNGVKHCNTCCPWPPLAPEEKEQLWSILFSPSSWNHTWDAKLTCGHRILVASASPDDVRRTVRCAECRLVRGIVVATCITAPIAQTAQDPEPRVSDYRRLTDSQWAQIRSIVQPEERAQRGRPRTDGRILMDAALYRAHTGITWRALPAEFGSWQTAARHHRQMVTDGSWDTALRTLTTRRNNSPGKDAPSE